MKLTHWRIAAGDATTYQQASAVVPARNVIEILSDDWFDHAPIEIGPHLYAADPWADWSRYTGFISSVVAKAARGGQHPIWEIQNEPENYPYSVVEPPTRARVETEYLKAYRAIKSADPGARVIGPSIDWEYDEPAYPIDMKTFVPFAAAHHLRFYGLAWHDNYDVHDRSQLSYSEMPQAVVDQAEEVRELIRENPGIGAPELFVDENSSAAGQFIPGFTVGYLAAEDQAGLDEANRSCWPYPGVVARVACPAGSLGQLLNADGKPNAVYWVMRDYADLTGDQVRSETSDINLSALSTTSAAGTTRILIGRHQTCSKLTTGPRYCAGPTTLPGKVPTTLAVLLPTGARSAAVSVQAIADSRSDMTSAPVTKHSVLAVHEGVASIRIPAVGDGQAYFVTVKPASVGGSAPATGDRTRAQVPAAQGGSAPTRLLPETGGGQTGKAFQRFGQPLTVLLVDQYGNPLVHSSVTFAISAARHGRFTNNTTQATVLTNSSGVATSPDIVAGLPATDWRAVAYVTSIGHVGGAPLARFSLNTTL